MIISEPIFYLLKFNISTQIFIHFIFLYICILLRVSFNFFFNVMHSASHDEFINGDIHVSCTPRTKVNFPWVILWMLLTMLVIDITTNYAKPPEGTSKVASGGFRVLSYCA